MEAITTPIKKLSNVGLPNKNAMAKPQPSAAATPSADTSKEDFMELRSCLKSVSIPAEKRRSTTANSAVTEIVSCGSISLNTAGPSKTPAISAPITCGRWLRFIKIVKAFVHIRIRAIKSKYFVSIMYICLIPVYYTLFNNSSYFALFLADK